jgi:hypothetical protein
MKAEFVINLFNINITLSKWMNSKILVGRSCFKLVLRVRLL